MENCSTNLVIHQGMGSTQDERFIAALETDYFLIDERKDIDYIDFVQKLGPFIKFFNESNVEYGNWSTFFQWESTSILVSLFKWDIAKLQEDFKVVKDTIKLMQVNNEPKIQEKGRVLLLDFFEKIQLQFGEFNSKIQQLDDAIVAKSYLQDTAHLIINTYSKLEDDNTWGLLEKILHDIKSSSDIDNPIKSLISKYQFDKNIQKLFGLLFNWKYVSGQSLENQLEGYSKHTPHYALFLAFLQLLGVAKDYLNEFTKRHLDFYYKSILQLKPDEASPDYVHLLLEPVAEQKALYLPKNTIFSAGKDSNGKNKFYASTSEMGINNVKLKQLKSNFIDVKGIRSQSDFITVNGTNKAFNVFNDQSIPTETGLLIASPLFYLSGGDRYININIDGTDIDTSKFKFFITGEKKCIAITDIHKLNENSGSSVSNNAERLYLCIPSKEKKIIGYDSQIHKDINVNTPYPVLKIVPINDDDRIKSIDQITIEVKVRNFKNFVLATDTGTIDISKPFVPFGDFPNSGNGFVICCNEFFIKQGASLTVKTNTDSTLNTSFNSLEMKVLKLENGLWKVDKKKCLISAPFINTNPITDFSIEDKIPESNSISGYVRFELNQSDFDNGKFFEDYISNITNIPKPTTSPMAGLILRQAPIIDLIYLDYDVSDSLFNEDSFVNPIDVFQILPFGYIHLKSNLIDKETLVNSVLEKRRILLDQSGQIIFQTLVEGEEGELYFGFENVEEGNSLNILFQLSEGSSNPMRDPAILEWHYLKNENEWEAIKDFEIGDETIGLIQSGLIYYTIPAFDTSATTILPADYFWIKIIVKETDSICKFIGVHDHAFKAVLTDFEKIGSQFVEHINKETITKLFEPLPFVKKVIQPYASFGGKVKESDNLLYQRTSERLRHKFKAITKWDYERIILQEFPNVYRVKCLNHFRYDMSPPSKISAGYITIIPIAKSNSSQESVSWKPLVSQGTINKIREFILSIASPHVRIVVKQPKLETIVLKFNVKYHDFPGADTRLYGEKLKEVINNYLSPWSFGSGEVQFANSIQIATLIQLIDDLSYVDFISNFEVTHNFIDDKGNFVKATNVKAIVPFSDYTLFVPPSLFDFSAQTLKADRNHAITTITNKDNC